MAAVNQATTSTDEICCWLGESMAVVGSPAALPRAFLAYPVEVAGDARWPTGHWRVAACTRETGDSHDARGGALLMNDLPYRM